MRRGGMRMILCKCGEGGFLGRIGVLFAWGEEGGFAGA